MFAGVLTYDELAADAVLFRTRTVRARRESASRVAPRVHSPGDAPSQRGTTWSGWPTSTCKRRRGSGKQSSIALVEIALAKDIAAVCAHELVSARARFAFDVPPRVMATLAARTGETLRRMPRSPAAVGPRASGLEPEGPPTLERPPRLAARVAFPAAATCGRRAALTSIASRSALSCRRSTCTDPERSSERNRHRTEATLTPSR